MFLLQPYMVPIGLLLIFVKNYIISSYLSVDATAVSHDQHGDALDGGVDDEEDDHEDDDQKKTLKARLQAVQEVTAMVQNAIGMVASLAESIKNTFNFSVPFLSWLAIIVLIIVAMVLYFVSLRFLVMVWGLNKFTKKVTILTIVKYISTWHHAYNECSGYFLVAFNKTIGNHCNQWTLNKMLSFVSIFSYSDQTMFPIMKCWTSWAECQTMKNC